MIKLYVASPLGFSEAGRMYYEKTLLPAIKEAGLQPFDPWALNNDPAQLARVEAMPAGADRRAAYAKLNHQIAGNNVATIDRCDALLAVLDGVDVDSGTAGEMGYAFAKGKTLFGYRGDFRLAADNEGAIVNLQVEYFIRASGGSVATTLAETTRMLKQFYKL